MFIKWVLCDVDETGALQHPLRCPEYPASVVHFEIHVPFISLCFCPFIIIEGNTNTIVKNETTYLKVYCYLLAFTVVKRQTAVAYLKSKQLLLFASYMAEQCNKETQIYD